MYTDRGIGRVLTRLRNSRSDVCNTGREISGRDIW